MCRVMSMSAEKVFRLVHSASAARSMALYINIIQHHWFIKSFVCHSHIVAHALNILTVIGNRSRGTLGKRSASPLRQPDSWCPCPSPMMSVPALTRWVERTIETPCAAVADRLKRLQSHVAKRMRSRSSLRFVAVSGSSSYERHADRRSSDKTRTLKAHQYRHRRRYAGLLLSFVRRMRASCTSLSISAMSVPPVMSWMSSMSSSASSSSSSRRLSGTAPVILWFDFLY